MAGTKGVKNFSGVTGTFNRDLAAAATKQAAAVPNLALTPSGTYTQSEIQQIVTKLNAALTALRNAGLIAP